MTDKEASVFFALGALIFAVLSPWGTTGNNVLGTVGVVVCSAAAVRLAYVGWGRDQ